jgi:ZIP family zinc transporter
MIPTYIQAGLWGIIGSFALVIGSFFGYKFNIPKKVIATITAFSAGILISTVCFELLFEAYTYGGFPSTVYGFILGVVLFTVIDIIVNHFNFKFHRNKYNYLNKSYFNKYQIQSFLTVAGVLLDSIPESFAIGLVLIIGGPISMALIIAVAIANLFEGASGSTNMKLGGWSQKSIFLVWISVIILTAISAMSGYSIFSHTDHHILSGALAIAAGALLSMIADVMLPEAYIETHEFTGLIMSIGFLLSFVLSHISGQ